MKSKGKLVQNIYTHKYFLFVSLILIHLLYLYPLVIFPFYRSHDGEAIVARIAAYDKASRDFHFPPRWARDFNYSYGSPVLNFYYPLPGYIGAIVHQTGLNFENSFKIIIAIAFVASPLTMYLWLKNHFSTTGAFTASVFWGLAPYHFTNLYVRGGLGELCALSIVPLILWALDSIKKHPNILHAIRTSIFYGILILMHNGVSLIFTPVFILYMLITFKNKKLILLGLLLLICGLGLSAYFWIPAIYDQKYTNFKMFSDQTYIEQFPAFKQLIVSKWGFGPDVNKPNGLSPQIGVFHIIGTILSLRLLITLRTNQNKLQIIFWMFVFILSVFLTLEHSKIIWEQVALLRQLQFPWRLNSVTTFASCILIGFFFTYQLKNNRINTIIILIFLAISFSYVKIEKILTRNDEYYKSYPSNTYFHGETSSIWTAGDPSEFPKNQIEIISGNAAVKNINKSTTLHSFSVTSQKDTQILDNTIYFPGWKVFIDQKETPIEFQNAHHRGLITFLIPPGEHRVKVIFTETKLRILSNAISLFTSLLLLFAYVHYAYKRNHYEA